MTTASHPTATPPEDYWALARQPLHSLLFLLPLLAVYEFGALLFAADEGARNGADYWLRWGLNWLGMPCTWLLPLLLLAGLALHHAWSGFRWRASPGTLCGMLAESLLFGTVLVLVGQLEDLAFRAQFGELAHAPDESWLMSQSGSLPLFITYLGAGVYEELLFRMCLIPVAIGVLRLLLVPRLAAVAVAVIATSLLFSLAHYVGPASDQFTWFSFVFRSSAGIFFSILFVTRGFGVTVGSHAAYDVIVGLLIPALGW